MIAVLIFYDKTTAINTGAKSWFALGPVSFQPSEIMKPAYILMLSRVVTQHNAAFSHTIQHDWQLIGRMVLWTLPIAILMKLQNDFGTTLVFLAIFAGVTLVAGINCRILLPIALIVAVPVRESDMIFSVIGEAFGFIGAAVLILLYFMLIYQMIRVTFDTKNEFYAYISTGVIMMILFHVFENIGMNIGLLPLTGIPLPFISQGGSFLLANMLSVGMVLSMRYHHTSYMFSRDTEDFE